MEQSLNALVSIVVPTFNRPEFVERLLAYYAFCGFDGIILIGDSSTGNALERDRETVVRYGNKLQIAFQEYPGQTAQACILRMLNDVRSPYSSFLADDDLLVPSALAECARFLEVHSDYVACHGIGTIVTMPSANAIGDPVAGGYYAQALLENERGLDRLEGYLAGDGQVLFALHRTEVMRAMFAQLAGVADNTIAGELLPASLSVVAGKIGQISRLGLVRTEHPARSYVFISPLVDRILSPSWQQSIRTYLECVAEALAAHDGLDLEVARANAKRCWWRYLSRSVARDSANNSSAAGKIGFDTFRSAVRLTQRMLARFSDNPENRMRLAALGNPRSIDYADYFVVLKALRGELVRGAE